MSTLYSLVLLLTVNEQRGDGHFGADVGHSSGARQSLRVIAGREANSVSRSLSPVHHLPQAWFAD